MITQTQSAAVWKDCAYANHTQPFPFQIMHAIGMAAPTQAEVTLHVKKGCDESNRKRHSWALSRTQKQIENLLHFDCATPTEHVVEALPTKSQCMVDVPHGLSGISKWLLDVQSMLHIAKQARACASCMLCNQITSPRM